ncbi:hypothetical protein RBB50_006607 [Rhinocladiella similis]
MALITIIGPILVWRASLTRRHKALASIGRKNNGYLSDGIPFWPGIRFFRVLRMPNTAVQGSFSDEEWGDFDLRRLKISPESPATWVQFGACLQAYDLKMTYTKDSVIDEESFILPVHRSYLLNFLVLGRYQKTRSRSHPHAMVQQQTSIRLTPSRARSSSLFSNSWSLHGLTGTLYFQKESTYGSTFSGKVQFTQTLENCKTSIPKARLSRLSTLLLMHGFLPLTLKKHICCIIGEYDHLDVPDDSDSGSDTNSSQGSSASPNSTSRSTYGIRVQERAANVLERLKISVYVLQTVQLNEGDTPLGVTSDSVEVDILHPMESTPSLQDKLLKLAAMTFIPPTEPYVRVYTDDQRSSSRSRANTSELTEWNLAFLKRESAQLFAFALLKMPWSPLNYVVSKGNNKSLVGVMLSEAGASCVRLLSRLRKDMSVLRLETTVSTSLRTAMDKVLNSKFDVPDLYGLDETLAPLQHTVYEIPLMVGILVLCNEEYRELIYQSIRHSDNTTRSAHTDTEFEFDTGNVTVSGPFGVKHIFVVDLSELLRHLPDHTPSPRRNFRINHANILLAAMQAHVRSLLFSECIDGSDIKTIMDCGKDVYFMS